MQDAQIVPGARVRMVRLEQAGHVDRIEGRRAFVVLDNGDRLQVAVDSGGIERDVFSVGMQVSRTDGTTGVVIGDVRAADVPIWQVAWADGSSTQVPERGLRRAEIVDPVARMKAAMLDSAKAFNLRSVAADLWARHRSEELVSLSHARFDLMPHQVSVLHRVVSNRPHRFLLCDEVGLGKTIEAAMVLKELRSRGLAQRVLILAPASIQVQWWFELKTKFNETFRIFNRETLRDRENEGALNPWHTSRSVITSHSFAAHNETRRAEICAVPWDLIVVDEAHHARRRRQGRRITETNLYKLVRDLTAESGLGRRSVLFLTATPMQLQHHELFSLVELLQPTLFPSEEDFQQHVDQRADLTRLIAEIEECAPEGDELDAYIQEGSPWLNRSSGSDLRSADELASELRASHRLGEVMLRNRRAAVGGFAQRQASQWDVELTPAEELVQKQMDSILRDGYRAASEGSGGQANAVGFLMVIYQKLAASSSRALLRSLEGRRERLLASEAAGIEESEAEESLTDDVTASEVTRKLPPGVEREAERIGEVIELLREIPIDSKAQRLLDGLRELSAVEPDIKVLIFTEFRETQAMLRELLDDEEWGCEIFHGQLDAQQKDRAVELFRDGVGRQALIATEAGGEGRNLQFAHILVNYDLPWNPMRVEQRIGRVDRIGQEKPIQIFNFRVRDTIEERILEVLDERIGIFKDAVGGLEPILGRAEEDIRAALRKGAERRDEELEKVGRRYEREVERARRADSELADMNVDTSPYREEIRKLIGKASAVTVSQEHVDLLLRKLLSTANARVTRPGDGNHFPEGQRRVDFGPPFTEEHRELLNGQEQRLVCFDPKISVDSASVEYFGFGHPIVDALVRSVTHDELSGSAAIRHLARENMPGLRRGWQFNWRLRLTAAEPREWVFPVFVDDDGGADPEIADLLLKQSRHFARETARSTAAPVIDSQRLDSAFQSAEAAVLKRQEELAGYYSERAETDYDTARGRIERLYDYKAASAQERLDADRTVLARMEASPDADNRRVIPIWQFNVRRAEEQIVQVGDDRQGALDDLLQSRNPSIEYDLLNVARIVVAD